ncbi:MAG: hypothetical protein CLLPBCKN_001768 [Chroococcidiopsis cubana SAG 39.79]|uniref:Uncharacterized protein n=1 Tax=Chroococcidiopsis cubana SAG 39.79 TaxID=388085 RepID=A0AB37UIV1_9CYAN|nr:hypothetical protein [Chroococcidiopsis cubana]MDZ4872380.1 hypothetical protein [Chroococcidiopsis cubana SAG 39.79]PSB65919.1 hypothetical protein C7B79_03375 [Chroococcidiopsis cubana CCALA 043]RUT11310.1 hypothetical protein DSM107010_34510 [Chroococcidiopsis cubana SAG 39.79]
MTPNQVPETDRQKETAQVPSVRLVEVIQSSEPEENSNIPHASTYSEKTDRLRAWSDLIKSASKFIWIGVVIVIVLQLWGGFAVSNIKKHDGGSSKAITVTIPQDKQLSISNDIAAAIGKAYASAESSVEKNLDRWQSDVMERVDHPFLDWYYNYFTQLGIGVEAIWVNITTPSNEAKAEKLIGGFQKEFTKQVLQPPLMQLEMERFTREAIDTYVSEANSGLVGVQSSYEIPQPVWEKFLEGLGGTVYNTGSKEQDLPLRALSRGTGYVATTAMMQAVGAIGTKKVVTATASKVASKAATKIATKTAGKVLAEGGGMTAGLVGLDLINPIAGLGVLAWDIWDHYHTVKVERPIMRENLEKYLSEVKDSLLNDKENGVLSSIHEFHDGIYDSLKHKAPAIQ